MSEMEAPNVGSWWNNDANELIQVVGEDNLLIDAPHPVYFKYWDGPRTNDVTGSTIEEFYTNWKHKFG